MGTAGPFCSTFRVANTKITRHLVEISPPCCSHLPMTYETFVEHSWHYRPAFSGSCKPPPSLPGNGDVESDGSMMNMFLKPSLSSSRISSMTRFRNYVYPSLSRRLSVAIAWRTGWGLAGTQEGSRRFVCSYGRCCRSLILTLVFDLYSL